MHEDYDNITNYCENLIIENDLYTEEMKYLDRDFTFEELCEILPKRPNNKNCGDDKIYYE